MIIAGSTVSMSGNSQASSVVRETEKTQLYSGGFTKGVYQYSVSKNNSLISDNLVDSYVKSEANTKTNPNEANNGKGNTNKDRNPNAADPKGHTGEATNPNSQGGKKKAATVANIAAEALESAKKPQAVSMGKIATPQALKDMIIVMMLKHMGFKFADLKSVFGNSSQGASQLSNSIARMQHALSGAANGRSAEGSEAYTVVPRGSRDGEQLIQFETERTSETAMSQSYSFSAAARVTTADGKEINIDINLNMSSELYSKTYEKTSGSYMGEPIVDRRLCDPLVINYGASSATLTNTKFEFDLDMDGTKDQISTLAKGSGFLALDKNGDGEINDGSELFGAASGNGFADLAEYDSDGNGWIDEADEIYNGLRIWSVNEDGSSSLMGLGEAGIGAIYLGSVAGEYSLGAMDDPDGVIRRTGFFLREDYTAGTVQHIDLAI